MKSVTPTFLSFTTRDIYMVPRIGPKTLIEISFMLIIEMHHV